MISAFASVISISVTTLRASVVAVTVYVPFAISAMVQVPSSPAVADTSPLSPLKVMVAFLAL